MGSEIAEFGVALGCTILELFGKVSFKEVSGLARVPAPRAPALALEARRQIPDNH